MVNYKKSVNLSWVCIVEFTCNVLNRNCMKTRSVSDMEFLFFSQYYVIGVSITCFCFSLYYKI